ncbi:MAG: DUF4230 domain-containing protein [Saprospiraceae bacterium]|jgi:hypothetical protein|nr:DUF4230 domain-containing protein [Saprospiraceae bacterium]MBK8887936.1 DUF4230 domain-containing protein [Saprospiraceae bacterium]MBK9581970.1 DUF4230 domain-containing protein [Saprospiraceae bacterium]
MIRSLIKQYVVFGLLLIAISAGMWFYMKNHYFEAIKAENTTIVLEKIKTVTKLISVEGQFSELYNYKESYDYDFFNLFSKKIILRVNAKVSVGYDFEKINISVDSLSKTVTFNELPQAEILSIDHDIDYYDISEGTFSSFTPEEYNAIQKKAKNLIAEKAKNTPLIAEAEKQKAEYLKMIDMALTSAGWKLIIKGQNKLKN